MSSSGTKGLFYVDSSDEREDDIIENDDDVHEEVGQEKIAFGIDWGTTETIFCRARKIVGKDGLDLELVKTRKGATHLRSVVRLKDLNRADVGEDVLAGPGKDVFAQLKRLRGRR